MSLVASSWIPRAQVLEFTLRLCSLLINRLLRMCHMMGRCSFAHNYFGTNCKCHEADLNNFSFDKLTHYKEVTFEDRCALALVPLHEALGQPEPADWTITRHDGVRYSTPPQNILRT